MTIIKVELIFAGRRKGPGLFNSYDAQVVQTVVNLYLIRDT